jgi:hypothetical protein
MYREYYGARKDADGNTVPNEGLRMTAEEVADAIRRREVDDLSGRRTMGGVADPSIFAMDGGPSIAERMAARKVFFRPADNTRVPRLGALGGWDQLRARLKGEDGKPAIFFFNTCVDSIRTIPALQHDMGRPEDVDSSLEDHAGDCCRYACASRPYMARVPIDEEIQLDRYARHDRQWRRLWRRRQIGSEWVG